MKYLRHAHPFLLGVFPVCFLFTYNVHELINSASRFLPTIIALVLIGVAFVLYIVWLVTGRDITRASCITSVLVLGFFSYGYVFDGLQVVIEGLRHRYFVPLYGLTILAVVAYLHVTSRSLERIRSFFSVVSIVLFVMLAGLVVQFVSSGTSSTQHIAEMFTLPRIPQDNIDRAVQAELPDIYYIVLDGYASTRVLETFHDHDNRRFTNYLRDRGFTIASSSTSNYGYTYGSLASSLNMQYLDPLADVMGSTSDNTQPLGYLIENNQLIMMLNDLGYSYVHFSSGYPMTNFNRHADVRFREGLDRFSLFLLNSTLLRPIVDPTSPWRFGFTKEHELRKRILFIFDTLQTVPTLDDARSPRFVFAHIVAPHHPYVFNAEGEPVPDTHGMNPQISLEGYREQLMFINAKLIESLDALLARTDRPLIIVIQSDHGTNPPTVDEDAPRIKFHNFIAILSEPSNDVAIPGDVTPVNIFRYILNRIADADLPVLPDRNFATSKDGIYDFIDVTDEVRKQREQDFDMFRE